MTRHAIKDAMDPYSDSDDEDIISFGGPTTDDDGVAVDPAPRNWRTRAREWLRTVLFSCCEVHQYTKSH